MARTHHINNIYTFYIFKYAVYTTIILYLCLFVIYYMSLLNLPGAWNLNPIPDVALAARLQPPPYTGTPLSWDPGPGHTSHIGRPPPISQFFSLKTTKHNKFILNKNHHHLVLNHTRKNTPNTTQHTTNMHTPPPPPAAMRMPQMILF